MITGISVVIAFVSGVMVSNVVKKAYPERSGWDNFAHSFLIILLSALPYVLMLSAGNK
jgi:glucose uptake protein GlcU